MGHKKDDGGNVERNLYSDEMDNVELDPEKGRILRRGLQMRNVNIKDRESVEADEIYQARRLLGGYLARVSTVINNSNNNNNNNSTFIYPG